MSSPAMLAAKALDRPSVPRPHRTDHPPLTLKAHQIVRPAGTDGRRGAEPAPTSAAVFQPRPAAVFQTLPAHSSAANCRAAGLSRPAAEGMSGRSPVNGSRGMCRC